MMNVLKKHEILISFYLLALLDICLETPFIVRIGLLCLLTVLSLSDDFVFALPVILLINDFLGTAIGNSISFYWLAAALVVFRVIYKKHYALSRTTTLFLTVGFLYCFYIFVVQFSNDFRTPLSTFCYVVLVAFIIEYANKKNIPNNKIFLAFGCACLLAAIQMALFGGIDYTTLGYTDAEGTVSTTRYGIIGVGVGDPNFSSLRLLFGMLCILFSDIKKYLKAIAVGLFLYCTVKTVSITAFILLALIVALLVLTAERGRKIKAIGGILLAVVVAVYLVTVLPLGTLSEQLSLYQYRLQSIASSLLSGDYNIASTGRVSKVLANLQYAFNRNIFKVLFGFDTIPPSGVSLSHNTFVDVLVRFGVFGFIIIITAFVKKCIASVTECLKKHDSESRFIIILKSLFIAFCFSLSIYSGVDVVLLIWVILFL